MFLVVGFVFLMGGVGGVEDELSKLENELISEGYYGQLINYLGLTFYSKDLNTINKVSICLKRGKI